MSTHPDSLSRRDALKQFAALAATAAAATPALATSASPSPVPAPEPEFVPENDYPFFDGELPEAYRA